MHRGHRGNSSGHRGNSRSGNGRTVLLISAELLGDWMSEKTPKLHDRFASESEPGLAGSSASA